MELPVVCTDADGLAENVADGVSGYVVPRRDAEELARAVSRLSRDSGLRRGMGRAGRERVSSLFRPEWQSRAFQEFYQATLGRSDREATPPDNAPRM